MNFHPSSWLLRNKAQNYKPPQHANDYPLDSKEYFQRMYEDSQKEYAYIFEDLFTRPVYERNRSMDWKGAFIEREKRPDFFTPLPKPLFKRSEKVDPSSLNPFSPTTNTCFANSFFHEIILNPLPSIQEKEKANEANQESSSTPIPKKKSVLHIDRDIQTLHDLIQIAADHAYDPDVECNICLESLHKIKEPLIELNNMIGLQRIKTNVLNQILYFLQGFHKGPQSEYMHTVIYGPPGTGKTEIAKIIGKIFSQLGILSKGIFKKVTRSELVAGYLGQTALKTQNMIKECLGGCLFIDEAYALGNQENKDSFSKECIDTLCEALSDHKGDLMVIIAGYEKELHECFFSYNPGLESRFIWRYFTEPYSAAELNQIFMKKVGECGWRWLDSSNPGSSKPDHKNMLESWFESRRAHFVYNGRDMESLLTKVKIAHSKRVFSRNHEEKRVLTEEDMEQGFVSYMKNEDGKKRQEENERKWLAQTMYV
jgi:SpoVK/Ycf46/Vps4 family AAA+-type ATPase